jgi:vanillate O-demethylase ferredoxin subunit
VRDAVEIYAIERGAPHPNARSYVYLNPYTADVLRFEPYAASSAGNRIYRWLGSLHTARVGGLPVQLLLFAGILGVPVLAYTGIRSALRRVPLAKTGRKPVMRAPRQEQGPPAESLNTNSQCSQIDFRPGT